jgi:hypothetical protein
MTIRVRDERTPTERWEPELSTTAGRTCNTRKEKQRRGEGKERSQKIPTVVKEQLPVAADFDVSNDVFVHCRVVARVNDVKVTSAVGMAPNFVLRKRFNDVRIDFPWMTAVEVVRRNFDREMGSARLKGWKIGEVTLSRGSIACPGHLQHPLLSEQSVTKENDHSLDWAIKPVERYVTKPCGVKKTV